MSRPVIVLDDDQYRALVKGRIRARREQLERISATLRFYGIVPKPKPEELVEQARERSGLPPDEALRLAQQVVDELRQAS